MGKLKHTAPYIRWKITGWIGLHLNKQSTYDTWKAFHMYMPSEEEQKDNDDNNKIA